MVELKEPLATLWRGKDAFEEVKTLQGEVFRELETRRTLRFELAGKAISLNGIGVLLSRRLSKTFSHCGCRFWAPTESGMQFIASRI